MKDRSVFVNTREGISLTRFGHFPDILEASTYQRSLWHTGIASPLTPLIVSIRRSKQIVSKHLPKQHLLWLHWLCKASDCVNHRKLWNILTEMGIPDHLTCLLRNWHVGQEATVRTIHRTTDWFKTGKWLHQGCVLSPCWFNLYAEYIRRNARLGEAQTGIKISGKNVNNHRYADDTTLMAESEEELSLLMKMKVKKLA